MARRKRTRTRSRRRRRIGAMALNPNSAIVQYGSIALGYLLLAKPIASAVDKALVNETDPDKVKNAKKMIYGGMALGGAYFSFMDKGKKSMLKTVAGGMAIGAGLKNGLTAFGIGRITGYGMVPSIGNYGKVPAIGNGIGSYKTPGSLNGYATPGTLNNVMGKVKDGGNSSGDGSGILNDNGNCLMG